MQCVQIVIGDAMSRISTENRNASDTSRAWRRDVEQWRNTVQQSLAESLTEVRELAEAIQDHVQQETFSQSARTAAPAPPVEAAPIANAPRAPNGIWTVSNAPLPDRNSIAPVNNDPLVAGQTPAVGGKSGTSEDRLAELARRLEEKLGRSNSRPNDGNLQEHRTEAAR